MSKVKKDASLAQRIRSIAMNLWWSWNGDAQRLFASLDPQLWTATRNNPLQTLAMLSPERIELIERDPAFTEHATRVEAALKEYLDAKPWFAKTQKKAAHKTIAYFCTEYAVHESMQQYAGGLGVLAGDHLKSASDLGLPLVGVGLLYRCGYYTQEFSPRDGSTRVIYPTLDFAQLPITDTRKTGSLQIGARKVTFKIWTQQVGRVQLVLLDTDVDANTPEDRKLTRHLYGGDREYRIRQEMLLGVGGLTALDKLGIKPDVCHLNEGHAAFCALERVTRLVRSGMTSTDAIKTVRHTTVFTTHTPVPAGNDRFSPKLTLKYIGSYAKALKVDPDELLALGRENENDAKEEFCMTVLALKLAQHCNGVAALHGETSRKMWMKVFGATDPNHVPIGHVTNGIHPQTWLAPEMSPLYEKYLKTKWNTPSPHDDPWAKADAIPDEELWRYRGLLRTKLIQFVRQRLLDAAARGHQPVREFQRAYETFDSDSLTIGFARRFATYKRAPLIFHDTKRLSKILHNGGRSVQIVFAGKAHPADTGGQAFAATIYKHARDARFTGRIAIIEDYDMAVGRALTSGADVWLNNPLRPQEASGTSGMKPPLHGGLNFSVLDGWWPEAWDGRGGNASASNGWAIGGEQFASAKKQDAFDANSIYGLLEQQIVPTFYDRDRAGVPRRWVKMMKASMRTVCAHFSSNRMVAEYWSKYYSRAAGV